MIAIPSHHIQKLSLYLLKELKTDHTLKRVKTSLARTPMRNKLLKVARGNATACLYRLAAEMRLLQVLWDQGRSPPSTT